MTYREQDQRARAAALEAENAELRARLHARPSRLLAWWHDFNAIPWAIGATIAALIALAAAAVVHERDHTGESGHDCYENGTCLTGSPTTIPALTTWVYINKMMMPITTPEHCGCR